MHLVFAVTENLGPLWPPRGGCAAPKSQPEKGCGSFGSRGWSLEADDAGPPRDKGPLSIPAVVQIPAWKISPLFPFRRRVRRWAHNTVFTWEARDIHMRLAIGVEMHPAGAARRGRGTCHL